MIRSNIVILHPVLCKVEQLRAIHQSPVALNHHARIEGRRCLFKSRSARHLYHQVIPASRSFRIVQSGGKRDPIALGRCGDRHTTEFGQSRQYIDVPRKNGIIPSLDESPFRPVNKAGDAVPAFPYRRFYPAYPGVVAAKVIRAEY